ncbi:MAG: flagellar hook-length control protein FliK [Algiphilus sp.]
MAQTSKSEAEEVTAAVPGRKSEVAASNDPQKVPPEAVNPTVTVRLDQASTVKDGHVPSSVAKASAASGEANKLRAETAQPGLRSETGAGTALEGRGWSAAERFLSKVSLAGAEAGKAMAASKGEVPALPRALVRELQQVLAARSESVPARLLTDAATDAGTTPALAPISAPGLATAASAQAVAAGGLPVGSPPLPTAAPQQMAEMAARVLVDAASEGNWRVTLRLDPPDMGRLDVQIARDQGALTAHFVASTPAARAAMEQAMPMLEAQMAEQGMSLADSSVSQERPGHSAGGRDAEQGAGSGGASGEGAGEPLVTHAAAVRRAQGLFEGWA